MNSELLWHVHSYIIPAAFALLPGRMSSREAHAMLLAIGLQESNFVARQQGGTKRTEGLGPAKSWWQFERNGGVKELLESSDTASVLGSVCDVLGYPVRTPASLHEAMEHNDVLAACMARLLLWRDPRTMPSKSAPVKGWAIYIERWRPGAPHPDTWKGYFENAWEIVDA